MMVGIRRWTCMAMFLMVPLAVGATYHPGDIGEDISTIQHRLGTLGYHLEADGVYGLSLIHI